MALFTSGRVQLGAARAQSAADTAALSAARELRAHLAELAVDDAGAAASWRARLRTVAESVADPVGVRVDDLVFVGSDWPPLAVQVRVSQPGPAGTRQTAAARAGLVFPDPRTATIGMGARRGLLGAVCTATAGRPARRSRRVRHDGRGGTRGGGRPRREQRVPQ